MLRRIRSLFIGPLVLSVCFAGPLVSEQRQYPINNAFFGFEFVLQPLAIKWACGGQREQDLSQIETLMAAFPEDAEQAELGPLVAVLSEMAAGLEGLPQILSAELDGQQVEQLCAAAIPLNIDWATPEDLVNGTDDGMPSEQRDTWTEFWRIIESLQ